MKYHSLSNTTLGNFAPSEDDTQRASLWEALCFCATFDGLFVNPMESEFIAPRGAYAVRIAVAGKSESTMLIVR